MPKIVCSNCGLEMKPSTIGVIVVEMAWEPPRPYRTWNADEKECPACKNKVIDGLAGPYVHYQIGFDETLKRKLDSVGNLFRLEWEKPRQCRTLQEGIKYLQSIYETEDD